MRLALALLAALLLASCPRVGPMADTIRAPDLETAAMLRGVIRDPSDRDPIGLYARDTDRVCVVRRGSGYRIGAYVDYGDGIGCSGAGALEGSGDRLTVTLGAGCRFEARFDGDSIRLPALLPDACAALCTRRASFAAVTATRLSGSTAEAAAMRDARGRLLCGRT